MPAPPLPPVPPSPTAPGAQPVTAPGAPRWAWVVALTSAAVSTTAGAWAVDLFVRPPSVEEEPEGMVFLAALVVLVFAVPALLLVAVAFLLRRHPAAVVLLGVSLCFSGVVALPVALGVPFRLLADDLEPSQEIRPGGVRSPG